MLQTAVSRITAIAGPVATQVQNTATGDGEAGVTPEVVPAAAVDTVAARSPETVSEGVWQISNRVSASPMFGLIRVEAPLPQERLTEGARLIVHFGDQSRIFPMGAVLVERAGGKRICQLHLMTHLVGNGRQRLAGEVQWADGTVTDLGASDYEVENLGNLAEMVRQDLNAFGTPAIIGKFVDSQLFPSVKAKAQAWFNRPESALDVPLSLDPARTAEAARLHLQRWGFAVLNHVIDSGTIRAFRAEYEAAIDEGSLKYERGTSQRIQLSHRLPHGRKIWLDPAVLSFLREWFRDEPCACQTLLYIHGSQQDGHQDTIHLTPYPAGYMCGVWVALQDIEPDSGELFVYPGSHRTPRVMTVDIDVPKVTDDYAAYSRLTERMRAFIKAQGYRKLLYRPKAGQILVWHENLIHGGAPRIDKDRERHSIVSHYFARGSVAFYDSRGDGAALERLI